MSGSHFPGCNHLGLRWEERICQMITKFDLGITENVIVLLVAFKSYTHEHS